MGFPAIVHPLPNQSMSSVCGDYESRGFTEEEKALLVTEHNKRRSKVKGGWGLT